jgi:hypothetical protein
MPLCVQGGGVRQAARWRTASAMALQVSWQPHRTAGSLHNMQLDLQQTQTQSAEQLPIRWAANLSPAQPSQLNALPEQPWPRLLCRSTLHCNGTSPQPRSFAAEPNKALEHVSPLNMEGQGRLPKYVGSLPLQQLPCGSFSAQDLTWRHITERSTSSLVTAIPKARLDDFVAGEEVRGNSTVNMWPSCSSAHLHFPASQPTCSQCCCRALLLLRQSHPALP